MMGLPLNIRPYQSLGDLLIEQIHAPNDSGYTNYQRWLSVDSAVAVTRFTHNGVSYRREVFASHPTNSIIIKITCDRPNALDLRLTLLREKDATISASATDPATIIMQGRINCLDEKTGKAVGMKFASHVKAATSTGKISVAPDGTMTIAKASEVLIYISGATSYEGKEPASICNAIINKVQSQPVAALFDAHLKDYQKLYNRVEINLAENADPYLNAIAVQEMGVLRHFKENQQRQDDQPKTDDYLFHNYQFGKLQ